jgi:hypothetical protein
MLYSYSCPPEDEHGGCSKHVEDSNKHIIEKIVRQVDYLPELYEDARSEKYKISVKFHCAFVSFVNIGRMKAILYFVI